MREGKLERVLGCKMRVPASSTRAFRRNVSFGNRGMDTALHNRVHHVRTVAKLDECKAKGIQTLKRWVIIIINLRFGASKVPAAIGKFDGRSVRRWDDGLHRALRWPWRWIGCWGKEARRQYL